MKLQQVQQEQKQVLSEERVSGYRAKIRETVIVALLGCFIFPGFGWTLEMKNQKALLQKPEEHVKTGQKQQQEVKKFEEIADQKKLKNYCVSGRQMKVKTTSRLAKYKATKATSSPYAYKGQIVMGLPDDGSTPVDQCHIQFMTKDNGIVSGDIGLFNLEPLY